MTSERDRRANAFLQTHFCAWAAAALIAAAGLHRTASAATVTFQQGVKGYTGCLDTFLQEDAPATPRGDQMTFEWAGDGPAGTGRDNFALIRFDGIFGAAAGQIPPGAAISSASLMLTVRSAGDAGEVNDVLVTWDENTTFDTFGGAAGVQAGDFGASADTADAAVGLQVIDVTSSVAAWQGGASNFGWIIRPTGDNGVEAHSSEATAAQMIRPKLTVIYDQGAAFPPLTRQPYLQKASPTSVTIAWQSETDTDSRVRYGPAVDQLTESVSDGSMSTNHFIELTGLTPATTYFYDAGSTAQAMAGPDAGQFFTTPPPAGPARTLTALIVGDSGTGETAQLQVIEAALAELGGATLDLYIHVGDMAYDTGTANEFTTRFFRPHQDVLRRTVCWPTLGNHEGVNSDSQTQTGPYYESYVLPINAEAGGVASTTEAYYSFDFANVHFICLDSQDTPRTPGSTMLNWLETDLAATTQDWVIAFFHHPPYSKGTHDSDNVLDSGGRLRDMRENVLPILEAGGVDLVLAGHSHIYERSFLVDGAYGTPTIAIGHIVDGGDGNPAGDGAYQKPHGLEANSGAVYVVAGHGGRPLGGAANHPLMAFSELAFGSCLMTINDQTLTLRNVRSDGVISDVFEIDKMSAPAPGGGCAPGMCGLGAIGVVPWMVCGYWVMRRRFRRTTRRTHSAGSVDHRERDA